MGWLEDLSDALGVPAKVTSPAAPARKLQPRKPPREIKQRYLQTRAPRNGDAGAVEVYYYGVEEGVLMLTDHAGKPVEGEDFRRALKPGDPEEVLARAMARAFWKDRLGGFDRPLNYSRVAVI